MMVRIRAAAVAVVLSTFAAVRPAAAQTGGGYFSTDNLGYTGSVSCYFSYTAALSHGASDCGTGTIAPHDLSLYFINGNAAFANGGAANEAIFVTNWYADNGHSPSNTNVGFMQMYDDDAGSVTSMSTTWDDSRTVFSLAASGQNTTLGCNPPGDCARLWDTGGSANGGVFLNWNVNAIFSGFAEAQYNAVNDVLESSSDPTSVTGSITGLFWDATSGRYYSLDAQINNDSWAMDHGFATNTVAGAAAPITATPEPASLALLATGLVGLGGFSLRRRKSTAA